MFQAKFMIFPLLLRYFTLQKHFDYFHRFILNKQMASLAKTVKPPNILVYSSDIFFKNIAKSLYKCLHADKYVVYQLKPNQVLTTPWKENVALLVVYSEEIEDSVTEEFVQYVKKGGNMLLQCSKFNYSSVCETKIIKEGLMKIKYQDIYYLLCSGKYSYCLEKGSVLSSDEENNPIIVKVCLDEGMLITSTVCLGFENSNISVTSKNEQTTMKSYAYSNIGLPILKSLLTEMFCLEGYVSELPAPTSGYVILDNVTKLEDQMRSIKISEISLEKLSKQSEISQSPDLKVSLFFQYDDLKSSLFDKDCYYSTLKTSYFGRTVVFFPVVMSTMYLAEQLSEYPGLVVVANRQLSGKGRGDNVWISPEGSAAFTLHFPLMMSSKLGQRLSLLQHMASLAVVHGLRQRAGYENLDFRLKWPNDIYYEKNKKIGGILVNTTIMGDVVHVYVGIGVNVANQLPTVCVNSVIKEINAATGKTLLPFKVEEVIAITLTELESLIGTFTKSGSKQFLDLYYKYWIHKNQLITLSDSNMKAVVEAIDDYGFLIVKTDEGKRLSLQPDGNRFDMMKNLIVTKEL